MKYYDTSMNLQISCEPFDFENGNLTRCYDSNGGFKYTVGYRPRYQDLLFDPIFGAGRLKVIINDDETVFYPT